VIINPPDSIIDGTAVRISDARKKNDGKKQEDKAS
jgi:hypothetical protein